MAWRRDFKVGAIIKDRNKLHLSLEIYLPWITRTTMRLTHSFLIPALCWQLASASAPTADVYIFNPNQPQEPRPDRILSPLAGRVVLAQRAGVEEFHSADLDKKEVIEAINDYGVRTPLFTEPTEKPQRLGRTLILVDGLSEDEGMILLCAVK